MSKLMKFLFRCGLRLSIAGVFLLMLLYGLLILLHPSAHERKEIYQGVYLRTLDIPEEYGSGVGMIAEVHWDAPGVELYFRPCYPTTEAHKQFSLLPADWLSWDADLALAMNSTRYLPGEWYKSYPFRKVDSLETVVWRGLTSHINDKSYMFGWDKAGNFHYELSKPPSRQFLETLEYGLGVQAVNIRDGKIQYDSLNPDGVRDARTFLGVDPEKKILWLMVFEEITEPGMVELAEQEGVVVGAQLDASDASTLIVGFGARDVMPHTGIRGRRPLANIIGVKARSLED